MSHETNGNPWADVDEHGLCRTCGRRHADETPLFETEAEEAAERAAMNDWCNSAPEEEVIAFVDAIRAELEHRRARGERA